MSPYLDMVYQEVLLSCQRRTAKGGARFSFAVAKEQITCQPQTVVVKLPAHALHTQMRMPQRGEWKMIRAPFFLTL